MNRNSSFLKCWPFYIAVCFTASFVICTGISIKCKPTEEEKLMCFAASGTINVSTFVKESKSVMDDYIREVEVKHGYANVDSTSTVFGVVYSYCDFYIFPESWLDRIEPAVLTFTKEEINNAIPNSKDLPLKGNEAGNYAIEIYNKDSKKGVMKSLITYENEKEEENYYLLIRKNSLHIGEFNNKESKNALKAIDKLLTL